MLHDAELSNHQLALTTLKYAIHHKPEIVIPGFGDIFPVLIQDTHVRPELVTTVRMGPFRHQVDDGLEMRKVRFFPSSDLFFFFLLLWSFLSS